MLVIFGANTSQYKGAVHKQDTGKHDLTKKIIISIIYAIYAFLKKKLGNKINNL